MNWKTFAVTPALLACLLPAAAYSQSAAVLNIQTDKPVSKVSPTLYGLMTEEINYSYDGGLYAEMVRNRTFRGSWAGIQNWFLVEDGNAEAKLGPDTTTGPSEALPHSVRLDVSSADASNPAGLLNDGYWGMPLHPNTIYKGSFYAKEDSPAAGPVTVSLVANQTGKVLASATVSGITSEWKQYTFTLKTGAIEPSSTNHLVLTVAHPGTLWLNLVSLFPPKYHDRVNGNRIDLMEKLAAMHPTFLRFPGGNYLEGDHIPDRYEWKKTIGPLVDRPTHPSPWRYHSTDGLGLLEFLEWGEVRAKNGHPEPFHLNYVEICNEDWFDKSGSYDERYAQFYKAIKGKYPDLQLIATTPVKGTRPDVIDDHFYRRATEFFHDTAHYDKTDRNGPKIFVGEWATREGTPTPNL